LSFLSCKASGVGGYVSRQGRGEDVGWEEREGVGDLGSMVVVRVSRGRTNAVRPPRLGGEAAGSARSPRLQRKILPKVYFARFGVVRQFCGGAGD
jgi:hypothetical protein